MHQRVIEGPGEEMLGSADSTRHWPTVTLASEFGDHVLAAARAGGGDGEKDHVSNIERIWSGIVARLTREGSPS